MELKERVRVLEISFLVDQAEKKFKEIFDTQETIANRKLLTLSLFFSPGFIEG